MRTIRVHPRLQSAFIRVVMRMVAWVYLVSPFFVLPAHAQEVNKNFGLDDAAKKAGLLKDGTVPGNAEGAAQVIGNLIGVLLSFVGIIFLVLVVWGGIQWMFAQGNEEKIDGAKKLISSAVVGLIIVFAAYAITAFVTGTLTSTLKVGG